MSWSDLDATDIPSAGEINEALAASTVGSALAVAGSASAAPAAAMSTFVLSDMAPVPP